VLAGSLELLGAREICDTLGESHTLAPSLLYTMGDREWRRSLRAVPLVDRLAGRPGLHGSARTRNGSGAMLDPKKVLPSCNRPQETPRAFRHETWPIGVGGVNRNEGEKPCMRDYRVWKPG
jgi:hypothetical protein